MAHKESKEKIRKCMYLIPTEPEEIYPVWIVVEASHSFIYFRPDSTNKQQQ